MTEKPECRFCHQPLDGRYWTRICPACRPHYCCTCHQPKPAGYRDPRCSGCQRKNIRRQLARPDRRCRWCPESATGGDFYCPECRRQISLYQQQKRKLRPDPRCGRCQKPLRKGTSMIRCAACARLERRLSRRHCGWCDRELKPEESGKCKRCFKDQRKIDQVLATQGPLVGPPEKMPPGPAFWKRPSPRPPEHYDGPL